MVRTAQELEGQYCSFRPHNLRYYSCGVEHKCGAGRQAADAREGQILPQQIVGALCTSRKLSPLTPNSWSRQIIEHERAEAAKEAAAKASQ